MLFELKVNILLFRPSIFLIIWIKRFQTLVLMKTNFSLKILLSRNFQNFNFRSSFTNFTATSSGPSTIFWKSRVRSPKLLLNSSSSSRASTGSTSSGWSSSAALCMPVTTVTTVWGEAFSEKRPSTWTTCPTLKERFGFRSRFWAVNTLPAEDSISKKSGKAKPAKPGPATWTRATRNRECWRSAATSRSATSSR